MIEENGKIQGCWGLTIKTRVITTAGPIFFSGTLIYTHKPTHYKINKCIKTYIFSLEHTNIFDFTYS